MWFEKKQCSICKNELKKSKLKEFETIEGNKILCCEKCSKYLKVGRENKRKREMIKI
jgi:hypothetical protein